MAEIILTIAAGQVPRLDKYCAKHGYTGFEADGTTALSKLNFIKRRLIKIIKDDIASHEAGEAAALAVNNVNLDVENNFNIT